LQPKEALVLNREHIEFVQAQMLPWLRIGPGLARPDAEIKLLSRDEQDGACSVLLRFAPGWSRQGPEHLLADEEFYVLEGALELNGQVYGPDCYACLPAGWTRHTTSTAKGCVLIAFYSRDPQLVASTGDGRAETSERAVPFLDVAAMAWDMSLNDPKLAHLGISRKNLRTDPVSGERTFLSLILPQAIPQGNKGPQETHPVVEESYLIAGSLTGPQGTMYPGAYFWRPPHIAHGPYGARWGSVCLMRFVGGRHVNIWTEQEAGFDFAAPYKPDLPPRLAHLADVPWVPQPAY
jgi:quercetin dioxygenase-like cupin family protein